MIKNLDNPKYVKHMAFLKAHDVLHFNMQEFGLDIEHIRSSDYNYAHRDQKKREEFDKLKSCFDYTMQQFFEGMPKLYEAVRKHRKEMQKGSMICSTFMDQYDIWKSAIADTRQWSQMWWNQNHPRTSCKVKCDKTTLGKMRMEQNKDSYWKEAKLFISPLWYHKVYKKGLDTVQYLGRPCFVADVKKVEIARLSADSINAYKCNIVSVKAGELTVFEDMWLASYQVSEGRPYSDGDGWTPPETINAVSPELRRAETNVSQRITKEVIGNLLD